MKSQDLAEQLKELGPDVNVAEWLRGAQAGKIATLSFEDSGKAIRALLKAIGKPYGNSNKDMSGKELGFRTVIWDCKNDASKGIKAADTMCDLGFNSNFRITPNGWFTIHIPAGAYYIAFSGSDDPEHWRQNNERYVIRAIERGRRKQRRELERDADYEMRRRQWAADQRAMDIAQQEAEARKLEDAVNLVLEQRQQQAAKATIQTFGPRIITFEQEE